MSSSSSSRPKIPLRIYHPNDNIVNRSNNAISQSIETIQNCLLIDGNFIEDVTMNASTTTLIKHRLNRKFRGYIICNQTSATTIYRDETSDADLTVFITLISVLATTASLWVF